jgi:hypothetical protein
LQIDCLYIAAAGRLLLVRAIADVADAACLLDFVSVSKYSRIQINKAGSDSPKAISFLELRADSINPTATSSSVP